MITTELMKKHTPKNITVGLYHDECPDCPTEFSDWKLVSFNQRHNSFGEIEDLEELKKRIKEGTAFSLSYFEHGQCSWSLSGEGSNCPWDSVSYAGVLYWEGEGKPEEEWARGFLEEYTNWCNGNVYGYTIEDEDGEEVDSCWGFYDAEYMFAEIGHNIRSIDKVKFVGGADFLSDYHQIERTA